MHKIKQITKPTSLHLIAPALALLLCLIVYPCLTHAQGQATDKTSKITTPVISADTQPASPESTTQAAAQAAQRMMADGYYFREPQDQEWNITICGNITGLPGLMFVMVDADANLMLQREIPKGDYTPEKPLVITFPKDGKTGDYFLKIIGQQESILALRMPLSDLPFEVYGPNDICPGHHKTPLFFQAPPGALKVDFSATSAQVLILASDGSTPPFTLVGGNQKDKRSITVEYDVQPGQTYQITNRGLYNYSKQGAFVSFDPKRCFQPDPRVVDIPWWRSVKP